MANICENTFYAQSDNKENIEAIEKFFNEKFSYYNIPNCADDFIEIYFYSKWTFPEEIMEELFNSIPDKEDIYMRCLSVEYGCDYVAYYKCEDLEGWKQIV